MISKLIAETSGWTLIHSESHLSLGIVVSSFHRPRSAAWGSWGISEQRRPTFQTIVTSTAQLVQLLIDKGVSIVVSSTSAILLGNYEKRILEPGIDGSVHRRGLKKLGSYKIGNNGSGLYQKSRRQNVFVHLS